MCSYTLAAFDALPETICAYEIDCVASTSVAFSLVMAVALVGSCCDDRKLLGTNSGASTDKYDGMGIWAVVFADIDDVGVPSLMALVSTEPFGDISVGCGCE